MKKVINYLVLLAFGAVILNMMACSQNEIDMEVVKTSTPTLDIYGGINPATKAVDQTWSVGDQIGVIGGDYLNACYILDETEATTAGHFSAAEDHTIYLVGSSETTFTAYAPYQKSDGPGFYPGNGNDGVVSVSTASQTSVENQETIDFLYASGESTSAADPKVNFTFTHQMAKLVLKVHAGEGFSPTIIQYDDSEFHLAGLCHTGTFNVKDGTVKADDTVNDNWNLSVNSLREKIDEGVQFTSIIFPQEPTLEITIKVNDEDFETTPLTVPDGGFTSGNAYTYTITVNENGLIVGSHDDTGCTITAWDALGGDDENYQVSIGGN